MLCLKLKKKILILLNWNEYWNRTRMNNWLKVLINANWKKKEILLVKCLIGTEKIRDTFK